MRIESGIPIPSSRHTNPAINELRDTFKKMKVGQSVVVDWLKENAQIYHTARDVGARVSIRKVDGQGWRVWRVA